MDRLLLLHHHSSTRFYVSPRVELWSRTQLGSLLRVLRTMSAAEKSFIDVFSGISKKKRRIEILLERISEVKTDFLKIVFMKRCE